MRVSKLMVSVVLILMIGEGVGTSWIRTAMAPGTEAPSTAIVETNRNVGSVGVQATPDKSSGNIRVKAIYSLLLYAFPLFAMLMVALCVGYFIKRMQIRMQPIRQERERV